MNSAEKPPSKNEHQPDVLMYPIDIVAEALREAAIPQEEFTWLADVLGGALPGGDVAEKIVALKNIARDHTSEIGLREGVLIDEVLPFRKMQYHFDVENTLQELNAFIAVRPGVFVIDETGGVLVSLVVQGGDQAAALQLETSLGPVIAKGMVKVHIDVSCLPLEEQAAIRRYKKKYEL